MHDLSDSLNCVQSVIFTLIQALRSAWVIDLKERERDLVLVNLCFLSLKCKNSTVLVTLCKTQTTNKMTPHSGKDLSGSVIC